MEDPYVVSPTTFAKRIAEALECDGSRWRTIEGVDFSTLVSESGGHKDQAQVSGSGQQWEVTAWVFGDGSALAEVTDGGWDVLDDYATFVDEDGATVVDLDTPRDAPIPGDRNGPVP